MSKKLQDPPEHSGRLPAQAIVGTALAFGFAADLLLHGSEAPGLNFLLLFAGLAAAVNLVALRGGIVLDREALAWLAIGLLCAAGIVLRGAPPLRILAFLAAAAAFALPALYAGAAWVRWSGASEPVEAIAGAIVRAALGPLPLIVEGLERQHGPSPEGAVRAGRHPALRVLGGFLLATPLLFVFGALFMSADPVFSDLVARSFVRIDVDEIASHLLLTGVLVWLASGYLTGLVTGTGLRRWLPANVAKPSIGILEAGTALALIDLLFATFVVVQLRYLFGGSGLVEVTEGLTYAEYAREGFAQLVAAAALVLPALLVTDWLLRREGPRDEWTFRLLGGLQLGLLLVIIASAIQRVRVYQDAYGLTESRFYGAAFLAWIVLMTVWFAATILRGRRERFTFPALVSAFALLAVLFAANPDVRIARTNLARAGIPTAAASGDSFDLQREPSPTFDAEYLASLGADAVPTLMEALPDLPADARCTVASEYLRRWGPEEDGDWRSWNLADARARRLVRANAEALRAACPE